jgi:hypothetical protein
LAHDITANISSIEEKILQRVTMAESNAKEALLIATQCLKLQNALRKEYNDFKNEIAGSSPNEKLSEHVSIFPNGVVLMH